MTSIPTPVRLIGNPEENFFILGKKHYAIFRQHQASLDPASLSLGNKLKSLTQILRAKTKKTENTALGTWMTWLSSYCEGLEVPLADYLNFLEQVEKGALQSSTSVFRWDEDHQRIEHLRLLDCPASRPTDAQTELILLQVPGQQALLLVCLPALPFLPLTLMNEAGVTLALHAKYHSLEHTDGIPVGQLAMESMLECRSITELKRTLKRYQTRRLWGLQACDPSGQVLAMDIMGPQLDGQSFEIRDEKILVFNNAPLVKDQPQQLVAEPPAYPEFCRERRRWALEKLKAAGTDSSLIQLTRASKASKYRAPAVTVATTQAFSLQPGARRLELLLGTPPMWAQGTLVAWTDLFTSSMRTAEPMSFTVSKDEQNEWRARQEFGIAQQAMDRGDVALAFHHIQMGLVKATGELKTEASWIWAWWQWRHLDGKRDRMHLPGHVRQLLSAHRKPNPHLQFLLFLLEVELDLAGTISPPDMPSPFREWADHYLQAPTVRRMQMLKTPQARLDILDALPLVIPTWTKGSLPG